MGKWIGFLIGPWIAAFIIDLIASVVMGGLFRFAPNDWISLIVTVFIGMIIGGIIYEATPSSDPAAKAALAWIYGIAYLGIGIWLGIYVEGEPVALVGGSATHHLFWSVEIAEAIGIAIGIAGGQNNAQDSDAEKGPAQ